MPSKLTDLQAAENHRYRWTDGSPLINVTAVSGALDIDGKSSAFAGAAVKLTRAGLNHREEWNAKADRGSRIHAHMGAWLRNEDVQQLADEKGYLDALEAWMLSDDPQLLESEQIVLSSLGYGGRFDVICSIGGSNYLVDLKAGKSWPIEHCLQLSAYRFADGIGVYDDNGTLTGIRELPPIHHAACLYVHEDGTYDFTEYPATWEAFETFKGLLEAIKWAHSDEMKQLEKEARKGTA